MTQPDSGFHDRGAAPPSTGTTFESLASTQRARACLTQALALVPTFATEGARERHRALLELAIKLGERALQRALAASEPEEQAACRWTLLEAQAARAEDARYGAGQLARGSQRAPTVEDCEDGWQRVESIVRVSEASAAAAEDLARALGAPRARELAGRALAAAQKARQLVVERNRAYTFHANPRFSFGEGWYLAAAAVLASVPMQLEPGQAHTEQTALFLREAGLAHLLVPFRPRPLANKALPDLVARAFRADAAGAQAALRAAFLGAGPPSAEVAAWVDARLPPARDPKKVLVWVRYGTHHDHRNSDYAELVQLCELLQARSLTPVLIGDALRGGGVPSGCLDLTLFWRAPLFQLGNMRRAQLELFEHLRREHGLIGQLGVTTAGMDGPALLGLPTMYLTQEPNVRLGKWVGAVPGYEEVVRDADYLERIARTLDA